MDDDEINSALDIARAEPPMAPAQKERKIVQMNGHRILPQAPEAELGLLASFRMAPREVGSMLVQRHVKSDAFHIPAHATVYGVMMELWNEGKPVDFIHIAQTLKDRGELERVGGASFISSLDTYLPTAANAGDYLEIIQDKATLREIIAKSARHQGRAYEEQEDATGLLEEVEREIMSIRRKDERNGMTAREVMAIGINAIQRMIDLRGQISGYSTGFPALDKITDGIHGSKVYGLCGLSGTGKSAIGMQILEYMAIDLGIPVAVWPLEMGIEQMAKRQIFSRANVNPVAWRYVEAPKESEQERCAFAAREIAESKMYFQPASDCTIQKIRAEARRLVADKGVRAILIDSMSVLHSDTRQGRDNRTREVAECAEGCKDMAKELGISVFVIVHIDRDVPRNARPSLNHIRESAQIEQAFDDIWMLHEPNWQEGERDLDAMMRLSIPKQRDGEPGAEQDFTFHKRFTRFEEINRKSESQAEMMI